MAKTFMKLHFDLMIKLIVDDSSAGLCKIVFEVCLYDLAQGWVPRAFLLVSHKVIVRIDDSHYYNELG